MNLMVWTLFILGADRRIENIRCGQVWLPDNQDPEFVVDIHLEYELTNMKITNGNSTGCIVSIPTREDFQGWRGDKEDVRGWRRLCEFSWPEKDKAYVHDLSTTPEKNAMYVHALSNTRNPPIAKRLKITLKGANASIKHLEIRGKAPFSDRITVRSSCI